jgi:hypothetical protein
MDFSAPAVVVDSAGVNVERRLGGQELSWGNLAQITQMGHQTVLNAPSA